MTDISKKMAKLLHQGATMLDKYCPKCGKILFRLPNDTIYCPFCEKEVKIIKKPLENQNRPASEVKKIGDISKNKTVERSGAINFQDLNNQLAKVFLKLSNKLEITEDMTLFNEVANNLDKLIDIMKKIRSMN